MKDNLEMNDYNRIENENEIEIKEEDNKDNKFKSSTSQENIINFDFERIKFDFSVNN